jgi:hypothetical protein
MALETDSFTRKASRTLTRVGVVAALLALAGAALVLLSRLNERTFTLQGVDGRLVAMKGRNLPFGAEPYQPSDPKLADAYAPIPLEGTHPGTLLTRKFDERDELDRALFELLERLARPRIAGDDPAELERGLYFVRRAEKLGGISEEQRLSLKAMQAEVSYYLARTRLDDARRLVEEALTQLKVAAESRSRHARTANQMISRVEPAAKELEQVLRDAVHTLSGPPADDAAPAQGTEQPPQGQPKPGEAVRQDSGAVPVPGR